MQDLLTLDDTRATAALDAAVLDTARAAARSALDTLRTRNGAGSEFLGWLDLPVQSAAGVDAVRDAAARIRGESDALIVVGIGGSYLGARAVIDACSPPHTQHDLDVYYAGHHLAGSDLAALLRALEHRSVSVNVISKSGTTTEPALAFRVIKNWMERRYGRDGAAKRIVATTDSARGALRGLADAEGYRSFIIPDDVGGRFSVLTPVGLLPIAAAGINIDALLAGARAFHATAFNASFETNIALRYAALRRAFAATGKNIEILAGFHPSFLMIAEWWKQLFGESEGKGGAGIFPAAVMNTTDLHSMGQYIQDGERRMFETFLLAESDGDDLLVPDTGDETDGLQYLAGQPFSWITLRAWEGTALAHESGGTPNLAIRLPSIRPDSIGALLYFFEIAVAISGYAMGVNPFDQPGVEDYKRNMFALLGKPGFEAERAALLARMK
ncbi:MAG: glucose-6-phosphate isomerase [Ignavibacteriae bacterium]|nr:glucose-6-phosphate isomerase [Ignavibacteriota bacterium]